MLMHPSTVRLPVTLLRELLQANKRILGVSVTASSHEVAVTGPPHFSMPQRLSSGVMLTPQQLKLLVEQQDAGAVVLGGSGLFRADGSTHFGVRKLVSLVMGISYDGGEWLPKPLPTHSKGPGSHPSQTPVLLCRASEDDAVSMLAQYITRHAGQGASELEQGSEQNSTALIRSVQQDKQAISQHANSSVASQQWLPMQSQASRLGAQRA